MNDSSSKLPTVDLISSYREKQRRGSKGDFILRLPSLQITAGKSLPTAIIDFPISGMSIGLSTLRLMSAMLIKLR